MLPHELLRKLLLDLKISQADLVRQTGLDAGQVSRFCSGEQRPSGLPCLYFAALTPNARDRDLWLTVALVTPAQRALLAMAVADVPVDLRGLPSEEGQRVAAFIDFWRNPQTELEEAVRASVGVCLKARSVRPAAKKETKRG